MQASEGHETTWRPCADARARQHRATVLRAIREFFHERGVLEVETPLLSAAANTDPHIESYTAQGGGDVRHLRTSPEFAMKRLLAAGSGPIYELGRVFRAGEVGARHNPEFTMLEWYRPGFNERDLVSEVLDLVTHCASAVDTSAPAVQWVRFEEAMQGRLAKLNLNATLEEFNAAFSKEGWPSATSCKEALETVLALAIEPLAAQHEALVITDFPAPLAALARIREDSGTSGRFEVYLHGLELANGYDELRDARELADRFATENEIRARSGLALMPIDQRLIAAQNHGLPACSGVALGVDRLIAALCGASALRGFLNFPYDIA